MNGLHFSGQHFVEMSKSRRFVDARRLVMYACRCRFSLIVGQTSRRRTLRDGLHFIELHFVEMPKSQRFVDVSAATS